MALTCSGWTSDTVASAAFATDVDFDILGGYVKMSGWGASVSRSGTEVSTFFWAKKFLAEAGFSFVPIRTHRTYPIVVSGGGGVNAGLDVGWLQRRHFSMMMSVHHGAH